MSLLNRPAFTVEADRLIYDATQPIDAKAVTVTLSGSAAGTIKRGQVIDTASGANSIHAASGTPAYIAAETLEYSSDDTSIVVPVYMTGTFRKGEVIADPDLTAADVETLRNAGIILK